MLSEKLVKQRTHKCVAHNGNLGQMNGAKNNLRAKGSGVLLPFLGVPIETMCDQRL